MRVGVRALGAWHVPFRFWWRQLAAMEAGHLRRVLLSFFSCVLWSGSALNRNGARQSTLKRAHGVALLTFHFPFLNPNRHCHFEYIMFALFTFSQPIFTNPFSTKSNAICTLEWKPKPMRRSVGSGTPTTGVWSISNCLESDLTLFTFPNRRTWVGPAAFRRSGDPSGATAGNRA